MRFIINDLIPLNDICTQFVNFFCLCGWPVHSGGTQQDNILILYAGLLQLCQQAAHEQVIRAGACAIGEYDTYFIVRPGKLMQRGGTDRLCKGILDRSPFIGDRLNCP